MLYQGPTPYVVDPSSLVPTYTTHGPTVVSSLRPLNMERIMNLWVGGRGGIWPKAALECKHLKEAGRYTI